MTDPITPSIDALAPGERVVWSGRSRPAGVLIAVLPNMAIGAFAACLAFGFAPASNSMGLFLSPIVESALRTVTPLPVPRIFIERPSRKPASPGGEGRLQKIALVMDQGQAIQPEASDVDIGVGAFLMVCKTLLLYLGAATLVLGGRTYLRQVRGHHVVTNLRVLTQRGGSMDSVSLRAIDGIRSRRHPFGTSLSLDIAGRRRPFVLLGLRDGAAAERAVAAGPGAAPI